MNKKKRTSQWKNEALRLRVMNAKLRQRLFLANGKLNNFSEQSIRQAVFVGICEAFADKVLDATVKELFGDEP